MSDLTSDPLLVSVPVIEGYKVLGGVVIYQKLGQGGMGAVYKGRHLRLDIDVAVKTMALPTGLVPDQAESFIGRFIREAKMAASVNHQNLVRVIDENTESGVHFLVMDYVDGETAGSRLKRKGGLSEEEAIEVCLGAAEGLAAAHQQGIVHRDVKPDNIMIDKRGVVRVMDLGLAKLYYDEDENRERSMLTQTQAGIGTPSYMAPEQFFAARDVGPTADVWSLGVTLCQLATGELPWSDTSLYLLADKIRNEPLPDLRSLSGGITEGGCRIIERALQKDRNDRYPSCTEMAPDIRKHLEFIRGSDKSALPDPEAGAASLAAISGIPPDRATITLIERAMLGRGGEARPSTLLAPVEAVEPGTIPTISVPGQRRRRRAIAAVAAGVGVLLLVLLLGLILGGRDPLEVEAEAFYQRNLDAAIAGRDEEVAKAVRDSEGKYGSTAFGEKIRQLGESVSSQIAGLRARDDAARKQAAFDAAIRAADDANRAGDLDKERKQIRLALDARDDPSARERLALVEKRIEVRDTVRRIRMQTTTGRWRKAWQLIGDAGKAGISDPRLAELRRQTIAALAPQREATGPLGVRLILVPAGTFIMGSDGGAAVEKPVHEVALPSFYIGRYETTRAQFKAFRLGLRVPPEDAERPREPVASVSWQDATVFCRYLTKLDPAGARYHLPTEAEWEYAARGTKVRRYPWGDSPSTKEHANLKGTADGYERAAPVGRFSKGATPLGVFDMAGNVAEWCADWIGPYPDGQERDPKGPSEGTMRVVRGGSFVHDATWARGSARSARKPESPAYILGFRVVRELTEEELRFEGLAAGE